MRKALTVIFTLLCCGSLWSQHWLGVSADANLAWQLDKIPTTTSKIGGGAGIGALYQFQYDILTIETGIEGRFAYNPIGLKDTLLQIDMIDTKGQPFIYNGYLKDRLDVSKNLSLSLPLMIGVEYNYIYGFVDAKLNFNLLSRTHQIAQLATTGDYDIYYEILKDMPNHGFYDYQKEETKGVMNYKLDVQVGAEFGAVFYSSDNTVKYRIGIFVDYGVLNVRNQTTSESIIMPDLTKYMHVNMNHVYSTPYYLSCPVHNLLCGIRFCTFFSLGNTSAGNKKSSFSSSCRCLPEQ